MKSVLGEIAELLKSETGLYEAEKDTLAVAVKVLNTALCNIQVPAHLKDTLTKAEYFNTRSSAEERAKIMTELDELEAHWVNCKEKLDEIAKIKQKIEQIAPDTAPHEDEPVQTVTGTRVPID